MEDPLPEGPPQGRPLKDLPINHAKEAFRYSPSNWYDWKWQLKNLIRSPEQLKGYLPHLDSEIWLLNIVSQRYPILVSPYYLSLIDRDDPEDPILKQAIPSLKELFDRDGEEDPLSEEDNMPVPGLTHRYPDRVLLVVTNFCTTFCRFCTRKRLIGKRRVETLNHLDEVFSYLKRHTEVRDVVISGGDPLTLSLPVLKKVLDGLKGIPHIEMVRLGTRVPVTLPMRLFDEELLNLLGGYDFLWINTHFNHPREVTPEAILAVKNLQGRGIPVNNQTVLLKGVNDSLATMKELIHALLRIRVRPYYIFHCDPVKGVSHFRTSIDRGLEIIKGLRGFTSGLGVPTYVVDGPGGMGKVPIAPNYVVDVKGDSIILRNYEGSLFEYNPGGDGNEDRYNIRPERGLQTAL